MQQQALSAIVAWMRLEQAFETLTLDLKQKYGLTRLQLAVLQILRERPQLPLAALRKALLSHPATLGQAIDKLRVKELVTVRRDPEDKRSRIVALTFRGQQLIADAPITGPVRLREMQVEPARLERLAAALEDAVELFGLETWTPGVRRPASMPADRRNPPSQPSR